MSDDISTQTGVRPASVPKEQLTAFQRWELASFDPALKNTSTGLSPAANLPTAGEMQEIQKRAYDEGHASGHQAGYAIGHQAGHTAGIQQAQRETEQLQALMKNLQIALNQVDQQLAQSLLDLALEIAHKMAIEALQTKPEIILKVVSSAISSLPHFNQNAHLILNPSDAELVRAQMGEHLAHSGWKIFTDSKIEPNGCRVETAHSHIDATNPARWQSIVESIGQHKSWLTT